MTQRPRAPLSNVVRHGLWQTTGSSDTPMAR